jgi:hypothetical protein
MPNYNVHFGERELLPEQMEVKAKELGLSVEELIKRFICDGMEAFDENNEPAQPGHSLEGFLVKNGALKPSDSSEE